MQCLFLAFAISECFFLFSVCCIFRQTRTRPVKQTINRVGVAVSANAPILSVMRVFYSLLYISNGNSPIAVTSRHHLVQNLIEYAVIPCIF